MGGAGLGHVSVFQDLGFLPPFLLWAWAEIPQGCLGWVVSGIWGSLGEHQGAVTYHPIWGWGGERREAGEGTQGILQGPSGPALALLHPVDRWG